MDHDRILVNISGQAYCVIAAHAHANGETLEQAIDELVANAGGAWNLDMPEMQRTHPQFTKYFAARYNE
jgi:hypothetical protein